MVSVSTAAVALLEDDRRQQGIPESHVIRIFGEGDWEAGLSLRLAFIENPEKDDHQFEEHGTQFYVAPEVKQPLESAVIDVAEQDVSQLVAHRNEPTKPTA